MKKEKERGKQQELLLKNKTKNKIIGTVKHKSPPGAHPVLVMFLLAMLCLLLPGSAQPLSAQEGGDSDLVEYVEVTNVELIVRAMKDGQPVGGLKESDFMLLENQIQLPMTSFTEVRQKIGHKTVEETRLGEPVEVETAAPRKPRMFLLYFWVTSRDVKYGDALDYFFDKVYTEGDQVLLVHKDKVFPIEDPSEIEPARKELTELIRHEPANFLSDYREITRTAGSIMNQYMMVLHSSAPDIEKLRRLRGELSFRMESMWTDFKYRHLLSNSNTLLALSEQLKKVNLEKWGMVFYQRNSFPQFDVHNMGARLRRIGFESETSKMRQLIQKFMLDTKIPNDSFAALKKIKHAFINGDATFHVLWMSHDDRLKYTSGASPFRMEDVFSGWMEAFSGISKVTGGTVIRADRLKETIRKVVEIEDIYYRVTYAPRMKGKARRNIEIRVNRDDLKLIHVKKIQLLNYREPKLEDLGSVPGKTSSPDLQDPVK